MSDNPCEEDPLPSSVLVFASPNLDSDEATAREAAEMIFTVYRKMVYGRSELEDMERALGVAEPVSARARAARADLQRAIAGLGEAIADTSEAEDALVFHWTAQRESGDSR
jgi:hypothetical protein